MMMKRSITTKLVLAFLIVSVAGLALASGLTYWLTLSRFKELVLNQARNQFVTEATFYYQTNNSWDGVLAYFQRRNTIPQPGISGPLPDTQLGVQQPPGDGTFQPQSRASGFFLADANGVVLVPAGTYKVGDAVSEAKLAQGIAIDINGVRVGTVLEGAAPALGVLETQYLNRTNLALLYAALGAAAVALALGVILARTLTNPLRDMTAAIRLMAKGDLKQHVKVKSHDELGELANAFNQMSTDLDRSNQTRRQMTADIAHDLRTPLTVIGGYVESMRDGVLKPTPERLDTIQAEVLHLQHLVEDLRTLSLVDSGELNIQRSSTPPGELLAHIANIYRHQAEQQKVDLRVEAKADLPEINVDPARMEQVLRNLVSNALRYTPEGGEIVLSARQDSDRLLLLVRDTGAGIMPEVLIHIFERFYRGDAARGGEESGLGLAIAKSIIELHGAIIAARSNGKDKGSEFEISFPLK
jgi:signal transduction histidine kinase